MTFRNEKGQFVKGTIFKKECHTCGTSFDGTSNNAKFCKKECRLISNRIVSKKRWLCAEYRAKHKAGDLRRKYNITQDNYDIMFKEQGGGCKICSKTPEENGRTLPVDHCHTTGKVRGLLCDLCNRSLGFFKDDIGLMLSAAFYLMEANEESN